MQRVFPMHTSWDTYGQECESLKCGILLQNPQRCHTGFKSPRLLSSSGSACHYLPQHGPTVFLYACLSALKHVSISQALIFLLQAALTIFSSRPSSFECRLYFFLLCHCLKNPWHEIGSHKSNA